MAVRSPGLTPPPRLAVAQIPGAPAPWATRRAWLDAAVQAAFPERPPGGGLVVLPEAAVSGYAPGGGGAHAADGLQWARETATNTGLHVAVGVAETAASTLWLWAPDGRNWRYAKRWPTFAEAAHWRPGAGSVVADTALGRIGLGVCADVVQPAFWQSMVGQVDVVAIAAAWGDYAGRTDGLGLARPLLEPWMTGAGAHRDRSLRSGARTLGVPVAYANATGRWLRQESFDGHSRIFDAAGDVRVALPPGQPGSSDADTDAGSAPWPPPSEPAAETRRWPLRWRAFSAVHRLAAAARTRARK